MSAQLADQYSRLRPTVDRARRLASFLRAEVEEIVGVASATYTRAAALWSGTYWDTYQIEFDDYLDIKEFVALSVSVKHMFSKDYFGMTIYDYLGYTRRTTIDKTTLQKLDLFEDEHWWSVGSADTPEEAIEGATEKLFRGKRLRGQSGAVSHVKSILIKLAPREKL